MRFQTYKRLEFCLKLPSAYLQIQKVCGHHLLNQFPSPTNRVTICPGLARTVPDSIGCLSVLAIGDNLRKSPRLVGIWELQGACACVHVAGPEQLWGCIRECSVFLIRAGAAGWDQGVDSVCPMLTHSSILAPAAAAVLCTLGPAALEPPSGEPGHALP